MAWISHYFIVLTWIGEDRVMIPIQTKYENENKLVRLTYLTRREQASAGSSSKRGADKLVRSALGFGCLDPRRI